MWQGLASLQVLRIAMTGLPPMSSALNPACLARERWPNERRSSRAEPAMAAQVGGVVAAGSRVALPQRARDRRELVELRRRSSGETNGGIGPVGAMPASSVAWCSTRAGPHASRRSSSGMKCARSASAVRPVPLAGRRRTARCTAPGAMQPEPVVRPASPKSRRWTTAGRSPMPLMTRARSTRRSSPSRYGSCARIVANDRVLDGDGHAVVHQPADGIEAGALWSEPKPSSDFR